jgi:Ni/Co efflux regulator RcnB
MGCVESTDAPEPFAQLGSLWQPADAVQYSPTHTETSSCLLLSQQKYMLRQGNLHSPKANFAVSRISLCLPIICPLFTETDRETDRQGRQTDRQTDRQTETDRQRQTDRDRHTDRDRQTDRQRQTDRDRQTETDRQTPFRQFGTSVSCLYIAQDLRSAPYPEFPRNRSRNSRWVVKFF